MNTRKKLRCSNCKKNRIVRYKDKHGWWCHFCNNVILTHECRTCHKLIESSGKKCKYCGAPPLFSGNGEKYKGKLPVIMHKYGKHTMSIKRVEKARDYARKHAADLVQPTIYDKQKKEYVNNPDYVKHHGDYKKENIVDHGAGNQEALDSGEVEVDMSGFEE